MRRIGMAILLVCMLAGGALAQDEAGFYEEYECPMVEIPAGAVVDCGYLTVPQDYDDPNSDVIYLAVAILRADRPANRPDPILYLEGGPGGSAISGVDGWYDAALGDSRDIILLDQRGSGFGEPYLGCEWYDYPDAIYNADDPVFYGECARRFAKDGVLIDEYDSANTARDIVLLLDALDIPQVNLYGISYGTRVALTMMRDFPERIRAAVLDSPYPPQVAGLDLQAPNGYAAIQGVLEACRTDLICEAAFPNLEQRLKAYLLELDKNPREFDFGDGEYDYTGGDLVSLLFDILYDTYSIPYVPLAIDSLIKGDPDPMTYAYSGGYYDDEEYWEDDYGDYEDYSDADLLFNLVLCREEAPFNSVAATEELSRQLPDAYRFGLVDPLSAQFATCARLAVGTTDPRENEPVVSDIPTLVLTGQFDPITPPIWGEEAVRTLSRGTWVNIPMAGHSLIDAGDCPVSIGLAFLEDPSSPVDSSCVASMNTTFALSLDE